MLRDNHDKKHEGKKAAFGKFCLYIILSLKEMVFINQSDLDQIINM